ncbi:hypothetical protein ACA910_003129 [Epithemia clementina (nom. ined.)]
MVQMTASDQAIVKAMPGNTMCCDCGMKNPQWASVSFGNVFCLECSGVHRSLGVHISFVRSIAMDSWTDQQLAMMKTGGNDKLNAYLEQKGIGRRTPIKQKYESDAAQLYKLILKARVEGKPEPTQLPKPTPKSGGDANGMERLPGETDQQYIARQTRLREEAKARMAAKFGGSGMGGVGSGGRSSMQGIGSDPSYNPNWSSSSGGFGVDSLVSGLGSALNTAGSMASTVKNSVLSDENINAVRSTSSSFWGSLTAGVSSVASTVTSSSNADSDGLAQLQREVASHKPAQSKYGGVGSEGFMAKVPPSGFGGSTSAPPSGGFGNLVEAQGLPGEDRNGIVRLTGESDEQYVLRQTRLRDEARARMAAKFGGQGISSSSSSVGSSMSNSSAPAPASTVHEAPGLPGEDRNGIARLTGESDDQYVMRQTRLRDEAKARMAAKFGNGGSVMSSASSSKSAPNSGNAPSWLSKPAPAPASGGINSNDFFSSFGS